MERYLYLVRHGSVDFPGGIRRCIGRTDLPLSEAGRRQARALGAYFASRPLEAVYASPLCRAKETARGLADGRYPVVVEERLAELDMGEWENVPMKELKKDLESEPEHGEGRAAGLARFRAVIGDILDRTRGDVAVVAHAGINCCYLSYLEKSPLETSRALPQPYGGFSRILVQEQDGGPGRSLRVLELGRMTEAAPSPEECTRIWDHYRTPKPVRDHCRAVAEWALDMARKLAAAGYPADLQVVEAAALLHDVAREKADHPAEGARILLKEGYPAVASIILRHHDWERGRAAEPGQDAETGTAAEPVTIRNTELEAAIVYLADKRVQGTRPVSLKERFEKSRRRCQCQPDAEKALAARERRYRQALAIEAALMKKIHH